MDSSARFDDARSGRAFTLDDLQDEYVAWTLADVVPVLRAAEAAADDGTWLGGWVAYDAAPALDAALSVPASRAPATTTRPMARPPLAWFGRFGRRTEHARADRPGGRSSPWTLAVTEGDHARGVAAIRRSIAAGITYQVNLTARLQGRVTDLGALYRSLVDAQGAAYGALLVSPTHAVVCASPELFFAVDGSAIETRPMKGTARRGRWPAEDADQERRLRTSPKERAENLMIVDLLRNDLGRVAEYGSVAVPALMATERYPTVWQMTSAVTGRLRSDADLVDVLIALFPSGSVTGAPKRAAMQAIAALESERGVYCGAVGYIAPGRPRRAAFAVAIRTVTVDRHDGAAEYGAGGGITWGSDAAAEWRELLTKTAILDSRPAPSGLIETMRSDGDAGRWHLDRMGASADYFGIPFDRDEAARRLEAERLPPSRLRLELSADGRLDVRIAPLPAGGETVRLAWSDEPVDSQDVMLFHKTSDRSPYERRRATAPDADDVILVNERGEVTETTTANIAVRIDGGWWTPPLGCGLLPGIGGARLIERGILAERVIYRPDVREIAVVSSLRGWRPATLVGTSTVVVP